MKTKYAAYVFTTLLIGLAASVASHAAVEVSIARTLNLEETPVDTAMSARGKYLFVLTSPRLTGREQRLVRLISK